MIVRDSTILPICISIVVIALLWKRNKETGKDLNNLYKFHFLTGELREDGIHEQ